MVDTALGSLPDLRVAQAYEAQLDPELLPVFLPAPPLVPLALLSMPILPVPVPAVEDPPVDVVGLAVATERCFEAVSTLSLLQSSSASSSPEKPEDKPKKGKKRSQQKPRVKVATEDRMDNNVDKVLRTMGYVRRQIHSRNKEFKSALMVGFLQQVKESALLLEEFDFVQSYAIVLEKQERLVYEYTHKIRSRTGYKPEYKRALKILASDEGLEFLDRALANSRG